VVRNPRNVNSVAISLGRCQQAADPSRCWISWMFDDCILRPGALSYLVDEASRRSKLKMLYGVTEVMLRDGGVLRVGDASEADVRSRIEGSSILVPNGGILLWRGVLDRVGWYDSSIVLRRSCDWDLFRRIVGAGVPFAALPKVFMQEDGELQSDSLRNAFTTSFDLMARFVSARDAAGVRLDLANSLAKPTDWIPPGDWSDQDIALMRYMFLEYFLAVGDLTRAFRWARLLGTWLPKSTLLRENLLRMATTEIATDHRLMAAGAYAAAVLDAARPNLSVH
jgi:hypothetical protein